ncbi:hypothetical protein BDY24DRAFT_441297 [Mrakia frigida]|uniref:uncharacterized protein n=1 Tax=Mrakia frigida TaxID=29902 RepID=UPI003FCC0281
MYTDLLRIYPGWANTIKLKKRTTRPTVLLDKQEDSVKDAGGLERKGSLCRANWKAHKLRCFNEAKQGVDLRSRGYGHTPKELLEWSRHWSRPLIDATHQALQVYDRNGRIERVNNNFALVRVRFVPSQTDPSKRFKLVQIGPVRKDQTSPEHPLPYLASFAEHDLHLATVLARGQGDCILWYALQSDMGIITASPVAEHISNLNRVQKDVHWRAHLEDVLDGGIQW